VLGLIAFVLLVVSCGVVGFAFVFADLLWLCVVIVLECVDL